MGYIAHFHGDDVEFRREPNLKSKADKKKFKQKQKQIKQSRRKNRR